MHIAWRYINRADATIAVIQDYDNMRAIINTTPQEIKALFDKMASPASSRLTGMPGARNPHAAEIRMTDGIDQRDLLRERYSEALEYMDWFGPAWETLSDNEKSILREYYTTGNQKSGAAARVECAMGYCDRQIRRIKEKALARLSVLLFGR
jgi:hypothetical protein